MSQFVLTETARRALVDRFANQASNGTLDLAHVHLTTSTIVPSPTTELGDLTEASFPGYEAGGDITWDTALAGPGSLISITGTPAEFIANGTSNETITGAYLAANAAGNMAGTDDVLLGVEMFDQPVSVNRAGQGCRYYPHFEYP